MELTDGQKRLLESVLGASYAVREHTESEYVRDCQESFTAGIVETLAIIGYKVMVDYAHETCLIERI